MKVIRPIKNLTIPVTTSNIVQVFNGPHVVKQVSEHRLNSGVKHAKEITFFDEHFSGITKERGLDLNYWNSYIAKRVQLGQTLQVLKNKSPHRKQVFKSSKAALKELRILPNNFSFETDFSVYGNFVYFVRPQDNYGLVINDPGIAQLLSSLFDSIWTQSEVTPEMDIPLKSALGGVEIPCLGIGTWMMGGGAQHDETNNDDRDIESLKRALTIGMTHIDAAEMYAGGYTEHLISKAIKDFYRPDLFIASKVSGTNLKFDQVLKACENSLRRLETDYLDLYLIHWPSSETPLKETISALDRLKTQGIIKNIGVSNFNKAQLEQAVNLTNHRIVTNQIHYNLIERSPEALGVIDYCKKEGILITAYRPLERGYLAHQGITALDSIAKKYGKTQSQVAINWLLSQPNVITIPKTSSIEHLLENYNSLGWDLLSADRKYLEDNISSLHIGKETPLRKEYLTTLTG